MKLIKRYQIGGYVQPSNVQEAINNGSAARELLEGFGKVMNKVLPTWFQKAGTYMSPLNYAAALSKGSINPKVGEEVISKWHPNIQLAARLGEAVFGGKAIKNTPKVVVNTAAKAGVKPAKAAVIAREIKQATKNRPNLSNRTISINRENNALTNSPDVTYTLYNEFGEPIGKTDVGYPLSGNSKSRMVEGVMSKNKGHKVSEDTYNQAVQDILDNGGEGLESGWSLMMPQRTLPVTSKFPHTVIGQQFGNPVRLLTGTTKRPILRVVKGNHYIDSTPQLEWIDWESETPHYKVSVTEEPPTSLKFFERKPSKISEAERTGVTKGERNNRQHGQTQAPYYDYSLINKHYEPWTVNEKGQFVFGSPEKAGKLGTLHFTFNEPVMSHMMGSWDDAPTVTLLPYRNIRSQTAPVDMAIMDTFFPNYKGLKISSRGAKTLTGDKKTFDYYKSKGLDVEFSPEMEAQLQQLQGIKAKLEQLKSSGHDYFSPEMQELYKQQRAFKDKINSIGVEWSKQHVKPIPSYEKVNALGKAEGFDMEQYPYRLATPKKDAYGMPLEASDTELNYTWQSDPSNHFMVGEHPEVVLKSALNGEYGKVRPEFIKYLEWASKHKADYRKKGGKLCLIPRRK